MLRAKYCDFSLRSTDRSCSCIPEYCKQLYTALSLLALGLAHYISTKYLSFTENVTDFWK